MSKISLSSFIIVILAKEERLSPRKLVASIYTYFYIYCLKIVLFFHTLMYSAIDDYKTNPLLNFTD